MLIFVFMNFKLFLQVRIKTKMNERLISTTLTITLLTLGYCHAQEIQQQLIRQNPCVLKQTCHECIQTPSCAWCAQPVGSAK